VREALRHDIEPRIELVVVARSDLNPLWSDSRAFARQGKA
jgi:hypothetical protein